MSNLPWSAEAEHRLRQRIVSLQAAVWITLITGAVSLTAGLLLPHHRFFILGAVVWVITILTVNPLWDAWNQLGNEETIWRGKRIPGSGMLANKPRDTSRLTKWTRHVRDEAPLGFTCPCMHPYDWAQMQWTANVLDCEEQIGDVPAVTVDPEGGRWVLICECGRGHYMLAQDD